MPPIVCLINTVITNCVLIRELISPLFIVAVTYVTFNFISTKIRGIVIYSFLPWDSMMSFIIAGGLILFFCIVYLGLCKADEILKSGTINIESRKHTNKHVKVNYKSSNKKN